MDIDLQEEKRLDDMADIAWENEVRRDIDYAIEEIVCMDSLETVKDNLNDLKKYGWDLTISELLNLI